MIDVYDDERRLRRRAWRKIRKLRAEAAREARAIYDLEMREAILRWMREQVPIEEIAQRLGQSVDTIKKYHKRSLYEARRRGIAHLYRPNACHPPPEYDIERDEDGRPVSISRRLPDPSTSGSDSVSGEVLDPPFVTQMRQDCLKMRKAMIPFDQMADILGISEEEARSYTAQAINKIQASEQMNADMERQLMIEQIDQMIQAIHAPATGRMLNGQRTTVAYEAIDRMLKLMRQKADLLGIGTPPAVDIRIKLQSLADEGGYDIVDIEEIARDVLANQKQRLPEFR